MTADAMSGAVKCKFVHTGAHAHLDACSEECTSSGCICMQCSDEPHSWAQKSSCQTMGQIYQPQPDLFRRAAVKAYML